MILLLNLLIMVLILCLIGWVAQMIAASFGAPPQVRTVIWAVVLLILLIWLVNVFAGGVVFVRA